MYDIVLKNFSDAFKIFDISLLFFFAIGLYSDAFTTGPTPDSSNDIYAKNCVIDEISPFTLEPNEVIIIFGTIKPYTIAITCNPRVVIMLITAFLLLIDITYFLFR